MKEKHNMEIFFHFIFVALLSNSSFIEARKFANNKTPIF
jgi:hypothetical protein